MSKLEIQVPDWLASQWSQLEHEQRTWVSSAFALQLAGLLSLERFGPIAGYLEDLHQASSAVPGLLAELAKMRNSYVHPHQGLQELDFFFRSLEKSSSDIYATVKEKAMQYPPSENPDLSRYLEEWLTIWRRVAQISMAAQKDYLQTRAGRGNLQRSRELLANAPDTSPDPGDLLN